MAARLGSADKMKLNAALGIEQFNPLFVQARKLAMDCTDPGILRSSSGRSLGGLPVPEVKQVRIHARHPAALGAATCHVRVAEPVLRVYHSSAHLPIDVGELV